MSIIVESYKKSYRRLLKNEPGRTMKHLSAMNPTEEIAVDEYVLS